MSEPTPSLSMKVESFVSGIVRFVNRYARTITKAVTGPRSFNHGLGQSRRKRRIVPPLTFLIVGCFLLSIIVDTYPEGWIIYFNWVWLDAEISREIGERGGDIFSLTSIVRSGLPTFMCFAVLAQILAFLLARSRWLRPRVAATITYAFGLHTAAFAVACFLPMIGIHGLNPDTSDSVVSTLWTYGLSYVILALTVLSALVAFISPILLLVWASRKREARVPFRPVAVRALIAAPLFLASIFLAAEFGSLPARFTGSLVPEPKVEYQFMGSIDLFGNDPGDLSGASATVLFHNTTDDLAYVDASDRLVNITISLPDETELPLKDRPTTLVFDEGGVQRAVLPILPGKTQLVRFETAFTINGTLGTPTTVRHDGSWWYDGVRVALEYGPISGAELNRDIQFELGNPRVHPR